MDDLDSLLAARAGVGAGSDSVDALLAAQAQPGAAPIPVKRPQLPQPPTWWEQQLAKVPTGLVNNPVITAAKGEALGAADPVMGAIQFGAHILPNALGGQTAAHAVDQAIDQKNAERASELGGGTDYARLAGNFISPANLVMANAASPVSGFLPRAFQGAKFGFAGGVSAPVQNADQNYWLPKVGQTAIGTVAGGIFNPLVGAIADKVGSLVSKMKFNPSTASGDVDAAIQKALAETGQGVQDIPPSQLAAVKSQALDALASGKQLDAAAALRKADFDAAGVPHTLGMITRDPQQWAMEQSVKGVLGAGRPLTEAVEQGNQAVMSGIGKYAAGAQEPFQASPALAEALKQYNATKQSAISSAYQSARQSGTDLLAPTDDLLTSYRQIASDFEDKVPKAVQSKFERLGFQFSPEDADNLRKAINDHVGSDPVTNRALGKLRDALNTAQQGFDAQGGPYAPAVKLAAQNFAEQRAIPALAEVQQGPVTDKFVQQTIINNPSTDQVQKLAALLKQNNPEAFQQARAQIGSYLMERGFGPNPASDKLINQNAYNKALDALGTGKLNAFLEPQEVEQLKRLGRIAAYQVQPPAGSSANFSNTASAAANLLRSLGGEKIPIYSGAMRFAADKIVNNAALNPTVPMQPNLSPVQRAMIAKILAGGSLGLGLAAPGLEGKQP